jgi:hypothetical protein
MAFTLATHLCGGWCSLSGVMQRTAKRAAKIEPLIALGLHPHCGPAAGKPEPMMKSCGRCAISAFCPARSSPAAARASQGARGSHSGSRAPGHPRVLARSLPGRLARPSSRALDAIGKSPAEAGLSQWCTSAAVEAARCHNIPGFFHSAANLQHVAKKFGAPNSFIAVQHSLVTCPA